MELSLLPAMFQLQNRLQNVQVLTRLRTNAWFLSLKKSTTCPATSCPDRALKSLRLGHSACCYQAARTGDTGHGTHLIG